MMFDPVGGNTSFSSSIETKTQQWQQPLSRRNSMLGEAEEVEEDDIEKQLSSAEFQDITTKEIITLHQPQSPQSQSQVARQAQAQAQRNKHLEGKHI